MTPPGRGRRHRGGTMHALGTARSLLREAVDRATVQPGLGHSEERLAQDARDYWTHPTAPDWRGNSHFRDAEVFAEVDWAGVGAGHWELFSRLAQIAGPDVRLHRIVEWGCGGGTNAVAFAPHCREFIGVDVNKESLIECG